MRRCLFEDRAPLRQCDLQSSNGTFVNGERITEVELRRRYHPHRQHLSSCATSQRAGRCADQKSLLGINRRRGGCGRELLVVGPSSTTVLLLLGRAGWAKGRGPFLHELSGCKGSRGRGQTAPGRH